MPVRPIQTFLPIFYGPRLFYSLIPNISLLEKDANIFGFSFGGVALLVLLKNHDPGEVELVPRIVAGGVALLALFKNPVHYPLRRVLSPNVGPPQALARSPRFFVCDSGFSRLESQLYCLCSLLIIAVRKWVAGEARILCGPPELHRRPGRPPTQK
jgi:hypothetical protein